ncbi:MAG: hypothetical protein CVT84_02340 [Alphaproteobacteria bacterium HGW-Alphaproteobacteria-6]|nr:MAG: hypothetical protein CVT84_02340 [Alphaproteobacteria bacterium HGW-Alphaproteobacteria-6]
MEIKAMTRTSVFRTGAAVAALVLSGAAATPVAAEGVFGGLFGPAQRGSFGPGGFSRYVPPVSHPTLNESPFITTEIRPIFAYHNIPNDFLTDGGDVRVVALQARYAFSDRFALIATTDGYADLNFSSVLPDETGFLDIAVGAKYAVYTNPAKGEIVTVGARYTAPTGDVTSGGIQLAGDGDGYVDAFVTGAKLFEGGTQLQGSLGLQVAVSGENWSYVHAHLHADHEVMPGFFPLVEVNAIIPVDGGNRFPGLPSNLTGADLFDIGTSDPDPIVTVAAGFRYRPNAHSIFGVAFEQDLVDKSIDGIPGSKSSVFDWRVTADLTVHF